MSLEIIESTHFQLQVAAFQLQSCIAQELSCSIVLPHTCQPHWPPLAPLVTKVLPPVVHLFAMNKIQLYLVEELMIRST